jgi:hypothetical protein
VIVAAGWRLLFFVLLLAVPFGLGMSLDTLLHTAPGCPGPFGQEARTK